MTHQREGYYKCEDPLGEKREIAPYQAPLRWGACTGNTSPCDIWFENQQCLTVGAPRIGLNSRGARGLWETRTPLVQGQRTILLRLRAGQRRRFEKHLGYTRRTFTDLFYGVCWRSSVFSKTAVLAGALSLAFLQPAGQTLSEPVLTVSSYLASTACPAVMFPVNPPTPSAHPNTRPSKAAPDLTYQVRSLPGDQHPLQQLLSQRNGGQPCVPARPKQPQPRRAAGCAGS